MPGEQAEEVDGDAAAMRAVDPPLPPVFGRPEARAAGLSDDQIDRRLRSRGWTPLCRGQYAVAGLDEYMRWRAEIVARLREHGRPLVLSHAHAARAWRLPSPLAGWGSPSFTDSAGSTRRGHVVIRVAPLPADHVELMDRVPVTSLARTVVDCARTLPGRDALAIADAALKVEGMTRGRLEVVVAYQRGWPGIAQARQVAALADPRRETPLESWSAWAFHEVGIPQPVWQVEVCDEGGAVLGRVDGLWLEGVAGEADGRAKYRLRALERGGADAETLARVLDEERLREMGLRRVGLAIVRWDPRDVLVPTRMEALAAQARRELGAGHGFRGRFHLP